MSTNTKLSIKSTSYLDEKKTVTDTINYVNPNISNATALELAQRLNALTKNSYKSTEKIETTELDSKVTIPRTIRMLRITGMTTAPAINLTPNEQNIYEASIPISSLATTNTTFNIWLSITSFNIENAIPIVDTEKNLLEIKYRTNTNTTGGWNNAWVTNIEITRETQSFQVKITYPETETYKSLQQTFNITITEG